MIFLIRIANKLLSFADWCLSIKSVILKNNHFILPMNNIWQKIPDKNKGYILTFIGIIAMSNVFIFSKAALQEVKLPQFGFYWFLTGFSLVFIIAIQQKAFKILKEFNKKDWLLLLFFGLLEVTSTSVFFMAIRTMPNPSIVAFMSNLGPVFVLILGFFILKERFNGLEILGIIITLTAAFLLSYNPKWIKIDEMFIPGSQYVLIFTSLFALSSILMKINVVRFSPIILALNRTFYLFIFSLIILIYKDLSFKIPISAFKNILGGAFLGPFLTALVGLYALKYIEVSRKSILSSTKGLFVLVGSYLYFGKFPTNIQIIGGILSIIGVVLIILGKRIISKNKKTLRQ